MAIVVFGSVNMDLVVRTSRAPEPGETLTGRTFHTAPGGKGANQAVACARLGAATRFVGRVGADAFGAALRDGLRAAGVDISGVATDDAASSGVALITIDDAAENRIIVVPGANGTVGAEDLARLDTALADANVLLLQLEIPLDAVREAARLARGRGVTVVLDPAPARPLPRDLYGLVDILTPNATEAAALAGATVRDAADAARAAHTLQGLGAARVVVKLGGAGVYWRDGVDEGSLPAYPTTIVDTVAAGDAFNGALAAALDAGHDLGTAVRWGAAAGALAVSKAGAQEAMPDRQALLAMLASNPG